ncbi:MAG: polysaccharide deacetylase family protein [Terracidiphilus sp.]|jgi:peptidoglycan/xylan/chitin deacetylase (PgdA/CDA1 family)
MGYASLQDVTARFFQKAQRIARLHRALGAEGSWETLEGEFGRGCPVLLYHRVGPFRPGTYRSLTIPCKRFEQQIQWLVKHGYAGIRPSEWLGWLSNGEALPQKSVMLTFDDAYEDLAEYAFPILLRHGFSCCVFVVTRRVGGTNTWDEIHGCGTLRLLNADQIRHWARNGIEFGAHSQTHADLTRLSREQLADEVVGSKSDLENLLGTPVTSFAYPYGFYNDAVRELMQAHFGLAFTSIDGINFSRSDQHLLRRIYIGPNDPLIEFSLSIRWGGKRAIRGLCVPGSFCGS